MKLKITEKQLQTQIINYLKYKGWYVQRLNSGKYFIGTGRNKRFIRGCDAGTPDLVCFKKYKHKVGNAVLNIPLPALWFIEVKAQNGKVSELQDRKMRELEDYGARCLVAYSLDDVERVVLL